MHTDANAPSNDQKHAQDFIDEALNAELKIWTLIHTNGPLDLNVKELYRQTRSSYENMILNDNDFAKLQDIEHAMWRLHYKHIDEFRSRMHADSAKRETTADMATTSDSATVLHINDKVLEGFRSFLSEATRFYQELITKLRDYYGFSKGFLTIKKVRFSDMESIKMQKFRFLCHRCLVCLGDLARYNEMYGNCEIKHRNWSAAASHYLSASILWPDSGNPRNQLAVLATYTGDELLAMYQSLRSLAAKEPFLNAWDNLILLFEKNRSSHLHSLNREATFNFFKPSERTVAQAEVDSGPIYPSCNMLEGTEDVVFPEESCLWPLIVRLTSIFYTKSSLEDFTCTFASCISQLEALLSLDDTKLKAVLESYLHMRSDAAKASHFRVLQLVCALIFTVHTLCNSHKIQWPEDTRHMEQPALIELALAATFILMGRLVNRCRMSNPLDCCPLLPAVLVFVEWLASRPDIVATDKAEGKVSNAIQYFFDIFVELVNKFGSKVEIDKESVGGTWSPYRTVLWEDQELRGFIPLSTVHDSLNFICDDDNRKGSEKQHDHNVRVRRILLAAMRMINWSNTTPQWIFYEKSQKKFRSTEVIETAETTIDSEASELHPLYNKIIPACTSGKENGLQADKNASMSVEDGVDRSSTSVEEDEIIVFKPITRTNSAPLPVLTEATGVFTEGMPDQVSAGGEHMAQSSSSSLPVGQFYSNSFNSYFSVIDSRTNSFPSSSLPLYLNGQMTHESKIGRPEYETDISPSPPSLSSWAKLESLGTSGEQGRNNLGGHVRSDIKDISSSFDNLSINGILERQPDRNLSPSMSYCNYGPGYSSAASPYFSPRSRPLPSAPLLPVDDISYTDTSSSAYAKYDDLYPLVKGTTISSQQDTNDIKGLSGYSDASSQVNDYYRSKWIRNQGLFACDSGYPQYSSHAPLFPAVRTGGAPWPHEYWYNLNQAQINDLNWLDKFYPPAHLGRFQDVDLSMLAAYDRWAMNYSVGLPPPLNHVYDADKERERRERLFDGGYHRNNPYRNMGVMEERSDQQQLLLQYLKDREWYMQQQLKQRSPN